MRHVDAQTWVRVWREAGPRLDAIRRDEIRRTDTPAMIGDFDDALAAALAAAPPAGWSGLVEQQRLFARLRG